MNTPAPEYDASRDAFDRLLAEMRPRLHRYCARMTGSAVDGEDVLQDTLVKALRARAEEAVRELAALSIKLHSTLVRQGLGPGLRR